MLIAALLLCLARLSWASLYEKFEGVMNRYKAQTSGGRDTDLKPEHLRDIIASEKQIIVAEQHAIPEDPYSNSALQSPLCSIPGWAAAP